MELDYFGIGYENYDSPTCTNLVTVIEADFTADDVVRINDSVAYNLLIERYEFDDDSADRTKSALERQRYELTKEARTVDIEADSRFSTVTARVPTRLDSERDPMDDPPQITWGGRFDAATRTVTFRHEAGESVESELLCYDINTPEDMGEAEKKPLWPDQHTVSADDETTIEPERPTHRSGGQRGVRPAGRR